MGKNSWAFSIQVYHEICWSTSTTVMYGSLQYDINNKDLESGVEYVFFQQGVKKIYHYSLEIEKNVYIFFDCVLYYDRGGF